MLDIARLCRTGGYLSLAAASTRPLVPRASNRQPRDLLYRNAGTDVADPTRITISQRIGFSNAGMALSLLPTKGMALPFVSYGISSVLVSLVAAGVVLSVSGGPGGFLKRGVGGRQ